MDQVVLEIILLFSIYISLYVYVFFVIRKHKKSTERRLQSHEGHL